MPTAVTADHRLAMLKLAVAGDDLFEICDLELRRGGQSYTVDTLAELRKQFPAAEQIAQTDDFPACFPPPRGIGGDEATEEE